MVCSASCRIVLLNRLARALLAIILIMLLSVSLKIQVFSLNELSTVILRRLLPGNGRLALGSAPSRVKGLRRSSATPSYSSALICELVCRGSKDIKSYLLLLILIVAAPVVILNLN